MDGIDFVAEAVPFRYTITQEGRRRTSYGVFGFCVALILSATNALAGGKRVLIIHSFGSVAPPFTTHSIKFETLMAEDVGLARSQHDWRELRRWKISENHFSLGSIGKYHVPTIWERHRVMIIVVLSVLLVQAALIVGLVLNLRSRHRAERSLRESEERMKLAVSAAELEMWDWDIQNTRTRAGEWKPASGEDTSDCGRFLKTVYPVDRDGVAQAIAKAINGDGNYEHVHRISLNGKTRWIAGRARVEFDATRKPVRMRGVGMDITARKMAEDRAKEAAAEAHRSHQELAHMSRVSMLIELAGSLAHELNQPLAAVVTNAEAAQRFMDDHLANHEEVREALKEIQEEGHRAGEIISRMRAMVKKDSGEISRQDLNLAVREVLEMARSELISRRVSVVLRLDPLLPSVNSNGVQLRQVLLNLVMNACDAMSCPETDRRQLTIESRCLRGGDVEISVSDSGPGFSDEVLRHVFEPFHTTKANGLGLGLAICRSIIRTHGGRLLAANNLDGGATLRFTLPMQNRSGV